MSWLYLQSSYIFPDDCVNFSHNVVNHLFSFPSWRVATYDPNRCNIVAIASLQQEPRGPNPCGGSGEAAASIGSQDGAAAEARSMQAQAIHHYVCPLSYAGRRSHTSPCRHIMQFTCDEILKIDRALMRGGKICKVPLQSISFCFWFTTVGFCTHWQCSWPRQLKLTVHTWKKSGHISSDCVTMQHRIISAEIQFSILHNGPRRTTWIAVSPLCLAFV